MSESINRFFQLVSIAGACLALAFGPLLLSAGLHQANAQLSQIGSRLFPFGRGLVHAYWAPNVWALYCLLDKASGYVIGRVYGIKSGLDTGTGHSSSSGLVGDFRFTLLPRVSAVVCLLCTICALLPCLIALTRRPSPSDKAETGRQDADRRYVYIPVSTVRLSLTFPIEIL